VDGIIAPNVSHVKRFLENNVKSYGIHPMTY